jgi:hypothetical protein
VQDGLVPGYSRRCTDRLAVVRRGRVSPGTAASLSPALRRATRTPQPDRGEFLDVDDSGLIPPAQIRTQRGEVQRRAARIVSASSRSVRDHVALATEPPGGGSAIAAESRATFKDNPWPSSRSRPASDATTSEIGILGPSARSLRTVRYYLPWLKSTYSLREVQS